MSSAMAGSSGLAPSRDNRLLCQMACANGAVRSFRRTPRPAASRVGTMSGVTRCCVLTGRTSPMPRQPKRCTIRNVAAAKLREAAVRTRAWTHGSFRTSWVTSISGTRPITRRCLPGDWQPSGVGERGAHTRQPCWGRRYQDGPPGRLASAMARCCGSTRRRRPERHMRLPHDSPDIRLKE